MVSFALTAQSQPDCRGIARDIDARCGCVKDPAGKLCEMVKAGFYDTSRDWSKVKPISLGLAGAISPTRSRTSGLPAQPARPQQARVVPLPGKDYLRFLHPEAQLAAGFNFEKVFRSPELMESLLGPGESEAARGQVSSALKEMDHFWLSFVAPNDLVILMTGKFEQGAAAGMFYAQGIRPVFLGGAGVMMIGAEPSIQAALARLAKPATNAGWVTRRARELSQDHETWIVNEHPSGSGPYPSALHAIRRFALGFRLTGEVGLDGEAVADSEDSALKISAWLDQLKAGLRDKTGAGVLDALTVGRDGATLRFTAKGDSLLSGEAGKVAMNSDFAVDLYSVMMADFPGMPPRTVAGDRLLAVRTGMKREEVLSLLGPPLSVSAIQGLDIPRETWTYQVPFGRRLSLRMVDGVVTSPPR